MAISTPENLSSLKDDSSSLTSSLNAKQSLTNGTSDNKTILKRQSGSEIENHISNKRQKIN
jgi:hypothetical protein